MISFTDRFRIYVNKGTNLKLGWTNTMICMKLSTRASTSFLCVCSPEQNAGKVYWQLILSVAVCPPGNHPTNPYSALAKMTGVV